MTARHGKRNRRPSPRKRVPVVFDRFSVSDVERWAAWGEAGRRFHWDWYSDLAYQRSLIAGAIRAVLLKAAEPFKFEKWQRVGRVKYVLEPLSMTGSLNSPGGRFNIGGIDPARFPPFPALYLASDKETAMQEVLGQDAASSGEMNPFDAALAKPDATYNMPVSGNLRAVIDLRKLEKLDAFVALIKDFKIKAEIYEMAKTHRMPAPSLVSRRADLMLVMLDANWRQWPSLFGVPNSSQIFGQLAFEAGIEGVIYPSKFNGKANLAIYPKNFGGKSFVELADAVPAEVKVRRLDEKTSAAL